MSETFFFLTATCFWRESENFILHVQRIILGEHIFRKKVFVYIFGASAKSCWSFGKKLSAGLSIVHSTIPEEHCGREYLFWKSFRFFVFFWLWVKKFRSFSKKFLGRFVITAFFMSRGTFSMKKSFFYNINFIFYSGYEWKFCGVSAKIFQQGCENCILRVRGNILRKIFFKFIGFYLISDFERKRLVFRQLIAAMLSYMHSTCRSERFRHEVSLGIFSISPVLPDFQRKTFGLLAKIFRQSCQNCLIPVQRIVIREQFFSEKKL